MRRRSKLKPKRSKFIDEYILSFDGKGAAIKAGYSEHTAAVIACQLLANPEVKAEFEIRYSEYKKKYEIRREKIIDKLDMVIDACMGEDEETGKKVVIDKGNMIKSIIELNKMSGQYVHTVINRDDKEQPLFPE